MLAAPGELNSALLNYAMGKRSCDVIASRHAKLTVKEAADERVLQGLGTNDALLIQRNLMGVLSSLCVLDLTLLDTIRRPGCIARRRLALFNLEVTLLVLIYGEVG